MLYVQLKLLKTPIKNKLFKLNKIFRIGITSRFPMRISKKSV